MGASAQTQQGSETVIHDELARFPLYTAWSGRQCQCMSYVTALNLCMHSLPCSALPDCRSPGGCAYVPRDGRPASRPIASALRRRLIRSLARRRRRARHCAREHFPHQQGLGSAHFRRRKDGRGTAAPPTRRACSNDGDVASLPPLCMHARLSQPRRQGTNPVVPAGA